jgi:hypothetical protein
VKYLIYIQDKQERINTAATIFTFLNNAYTYTPLNKDITVGVGGEANDKALAQIAALIDRRGYNIKVESPEPPELSTDYVSNHSS